MTILDKAEHFKNSVARNVDALLKVIPNIQGAFNGFHGYAWTAMKNPNVLLLPTFAEKHHKAYKQMVDVCVYYFGDNHFFNMCTRMAEIASIKAGGEHLQNAAKRQAMMAAFARVQKSILFADDIQVQWDHLVKTVAKKGLGFMDHLHPMDEMLNAIRGLLIQINEAMSTLTSKMGVQDLVADMLKYYEQVNDQVEEAILA